MRISIIDNVSFTQKQLEKLKGVSDELKIYEDIAVNDDEITLRCEDSDIVILGWTKLNEKILSQLDQLKFIAIWATGYDYVDVNYAHSKGIIVSNVPNYASEAVAEYIIGGFLAVSRNFINVNNHVLNGEYSWRDFSGSELNGKILGIVGFGGIGKRVAELGGAFGMQIFSYTKNPSKYFDFSSKINFVSLDYLFSKSDFISINIPLSSETNRIINPILLNKLKKDAIIVNISRHEVIDQDYLVNMLEKNLLKGAALDDIYVDDIRVKKLKNVLLTPHIGFFTQEALIRKSEICLENIIAFILGNPRNIIL